MNESSLERRVANFILAARLRALFKRNDQRIARATARLAAHRAGA